MTRRPTLRHCLTCKRRLSTFYAVAFTRKNRKKSWPKYLSPSIPTKSEKLRVIMITIMYY